MEHLPLITGSMGSGKSTILAEASDLLRAAAVPHAAIDLDALGIAHLAGIDKHDLEIRNLAAVAANYAAAGIRRLLIAAAVESRAELERIAAATGAQSVVVCRLRAAPTVMEARVAAREQGVLADRYGARVRVLERLLDEAAVEEFTLRTDDASVTT